MVRYHDYAFYMLLLSNLIIRIYIYQHCLFIWRYDNADNYYRDRSKSFVWT